MTRDDVLEKMRERAHHPATARDLARILKVPREQRATFTRHLKSLLASGDLVQVRGNRLGLPDKMDLMVGRLQVNPSGFGFGSTFKTCSASRRSSRVVILRFIAGQGTTVTAWPSRSTS